MDETNDYCVRADSPANISEQDLAACLSIIKVGGAVDPKSAERSLSIASMLAVVRIDRQVVGVGAVKPIRPGYAAKVAEKSGTEFDSNTPELGYVAVHPDHQNNKLATRIVRELLSANGGTLFATTSNPWMKSTLERAGFAQRGDEWSGNSGRLSLWIKT
jgi:GNAT superfamily N-acetyltransferase